MLRKNSQYKTYVDDHFIDLLINAIDNNTIQPISEALNYKNIGKKCKDCGKITKNCQCEKCYSEEYSECGQNYCICELTKNMFRGPSPLEIAVNVAIEFLSKDQLIIFKEKLNKLTIRDLYKNIYGVSFKEMNKKIDRILYG